MKMIFWGIKDKQ